MSERLNNAPSAHMDVDSAFDSEKRQAQSEWDSYLEQRDYRDEAGNLHDASTGKFKSDPNNETDDEYYNRVHAEAESEVDTRFAGKGLRSLAEMVRDARAAGDKTAELDARAAFDDAFIAEAEKQGWEGVVEHEDGTIEDRNEIADRRLSYFEGIMDGVSSQEGRRDPREEGADSVDDAVTEAEGKEAAPEDAAGELEDLDTPVDTDLESSDYPGDLDAPVDTNLESLGDSDDIDTPVNTDLESSEGLDDLDTPVDTSLEGSEHVDDLDTPVDTSLDDGQDVEKESLLTQTKNKFLSASVYLRNRFINFRERLQDPEADLSKERRIALGALATAGGLLLLAYLTKEGFDTSSATSEGLGNIGLDTGADLGEASTELLEPDVVGNGTTPDTLGTSAGVGVSEKMQKMMDGVRDLADQAGEGSEGSFIELNEYIDNLSEKARTIERGEGGFQTLKEMGIPESQWEQKWEDVGNALTAEGRGDLVYRMDDGRWGWQTPGTLDNDTLQTIARIVRR